MRIDIYKIETKHPAGFNKVEIENLLKDYPEINLEKFYNALRGITCQFSEEDGIIIYPCDIDLALNCGLDNRNPTSLEWD